jgi:hypothetical protein
MKSLCLDAHAFNAPSAAGGQRAAKHLHYPSKLTPCCWIFLKWNSYIVIPQQTNHKNPQYHSSHLSRERDIKEMLIATVCNSPCKLSLFFLLVEQHIYILSLSSMLLRCRCKQGNNEHTITRANFCHQGLQMVNFSRKWRKNECSSFHHKRASGCTQCHHQRVQNTD